MRTHAFILFLFVLSIRFIILPLTPLRVAAATELRSQTEEQAAGGSGERLDNAILSLCQKPHNLKNSLQEAKALPAARHFAQAQTGGTVWRWQGKQCAPGAGCGQAKKLQLWRAKIL